ncbi:MAG TPA: acid phosphatase, partial [bacterium]|nr:acid phosphatase [bacterium]
IVTFDECRTGVTNHIYAVLLGPMVRTGTRDGRWYTHFDLLRTIEDNFGLGTLRREDQAAESFRDVWR